MVKTQLNFPPFSFLFHETDSNKSIRVCYAEGASEERIQYWDSEP